MNVKSSMKLSSLFVSMLMGVSLFIPSVSFAQTQTTAELIQSLRVQIATLTAQIAQLQASGGNGGGGSQDGSSNPTQWCYAFNSNLGIGSRGKNVSALQHALNLELGTQIEETGYFGMNTASAVANFQDKYSDEILTSNNLSRGTGFVGVSTRRKLNQLYGCGNVVPVNTQAPVISGVQGPTALKVGETGTWSVSAYDPQNGVLSYSVIWGDEMAQPMPAPSPAPLSLAPVQQTATFTHSYANARIYTPVFYVTDNQVLSAKTSISVNVGETTPQSLGRLFIEVDTGSGFMQTSDAIKVDVGQSRRVRAMYQLPMPPCLGGPAAGVCLEIMPVPQEVSAQWTSSNPNIAGIITVETDCINTSPNPSALCGSALSMIRGISAGTAEIKALYAPYPNAYTATAKVNVVFPPTQPSITVISPNGGEQWQVGSTYEIRWKAVGTVNTNLNIYLSGGGYEEGSARWIASVNASVGSTRLTMTTNDLPKAPGYTWRVLICDGVLGSCTTAGLSGEFTIISATTQPSITVISPNGGEMWTLGSGASLIWKTSGVPSTNEITAGVRNIVTGQDYTLGLLYNDGNEIAAVPLTFPVGSYLGFLKTSVNGQTISDFTDGPISVVTPSTQPSITVIYPTSGLVGTNVTITGTGFTSTNNSVKFGGGYMNGLNSNGTSITFTVPDGLTPCPPSATICPESFMLVTPGTYPVSVINANGTSNALSFMVTAVSNYPGFFMKLDKSTYAPTDMLVLTSSRADGKTAYYPVDIYAVRSKDNVKTLIHASEFIASSTNTYIYLDRWEIFQNGGAGDYLILFCDASKECVGGVNTNSIGFSIAAVSSGGGGGGGGGGSTGALVPTSQIASVTSANVLEAIRLQLVWLAEVIKKISQ